MICFCDGLLSLMTKNMHGISGRLCCWVFYFMQWRLGLLSRDVHVLPRVLHHHCLWNILGIPDSTACE